MKPKFKHYTVGFYMNHELDSVVLIRKVKPPWQNGLLNGVGGSFEKGETALACMVREFQEETGHLTTAWIEFAQGQITCHQGPCFLHYMITNGDNFSPRTDQPEVAVWIYLPKLLNYAIVPNLNWLIPMGLLKYRRPQWVEKANFQTL